MKMTKLIMIASLSLAGNCMAQILHAFPNQMTAPTNRYFCPPGVPPTVSLFANIQEPNVRLTSAFGPVVERPMSNSICIDLSLHPEAVVLLMQQEKHHADRIAVMERQAAATEKLTMQMETWMKRAEQDLRGAIDAKFKALPTEIVSSKAHMASLATLRAEILKEVECKRDPGNNCS